MHPVQSNAIYQRRPRLVLGIYAVVWLAAVVGLTAWQWYSFTGGADLWFFALLVAFGSAIFWSPDIVRAVRSRRK